MTGVQYRVDLPKVIATIFHNHRLGVADLIHHESRETLHALGGIVNIRQVRRRDVVLRPRLSLVTRDTYQKLSVLRRSIGNDTGPFVEIESVRSVIGMRCSAAVVVELDGEVIVFGLVDGGAHVNVLILFAVEIALWRT